MVMVRRRQDPDIHYFFQNMKWMDPLCLQNGFFGGWTKASRLYYEVTENAKILQYDIDSLCPSVNKNNKYSIGHPDPPTLKLLINTLD